MRQAYNSPVAKNSHTSKLSPVVGNIACLTIRHQTHLLCGDANSSVPVINRRQPLPKG